MDNSRKKNEGIAKKLTEKLRGIITDIVSSSSLSCKFCLFIHIIYIVNRDFEEIPSGLINEE
jgi:hypothetical protein